jgi:hypothetical protein
MDKEVKTLLDKIAKVLKTKKTYESSSVIDKLMGEVFQLSTGTSARSYEEIEKDIDNLIA